MSCPFYAIFKETRFKYLTNLSIYSTYSLAYPYFPHSDNCLVNWKNEAHWMDTSDKMLISNSRDTDVFTAT